MSTAAQRRHYTVSPGIVTTWTTGNFPSNPAEQCVVLAVVPHQVDAAHKIEPDHELFNNSPTAVAAAIVHQNHLGRLEFLEDRYKSPDEKWKTRLGVVHRDDNRNGFRKHF